MDGELSRIIDKRQIHCVFQPIADASREGVLGFEALARGPASGPLTSPLALFSQAAASGLIESLDALCIATAVRDFSALGAPGLLFVNLTPQGLLAVGTDIEPFAATLRRAGLPADRVVVELTERSILEDHAGIRSAIDRIRSLGVAFAIDDLGAGYSGLRVWAELAPDYVKIDRYFVDGIERDAIRMEFVRSIVDMAHAARSVVIAEGVENSAQATELRDAGVNYLQGFHIARPSKTPVTSLSDTAVTRISGPSPARQALKTGDLVFPNPTVQPGAPVRDVADMFHGDAALLAIPVLEGRRPRGIVYRAELLDLLSLPLRMELYGRKSIAEQMRTDPALIDASLRLDQASRIVTRRYNERLQEQFIVTTEGRYVGMARVVDLLRHITEEQILTARYANPLTTLPGNVPIYDRLNDLLRRQKPFVLCHVDIDNFKPFNDQYGYPKGDEALIAVSEVLTKHASPRMDFVGHVGGDDFVIIFRTEDWRDRVQAIFAAVDASRACLYQPEHLASGGISALDRYGVSRKFPLLSVSVAALVCDGRLDCSAEDLAQRLAPLKNDAKTLKGNSLAVGRATPHGAESVSVEGELRKASA